MPQLAPPPNRPPEEVPFIPNDKPQFTDEPYSGKDGIDLYVDYGRFLPENATYTRVTVHGFTKTMKAFMKPTFFGPDIAVSRVREPFYGNRTELRVKGLDPTACLIFTLDTFDLSKGEYCILGHAVFPLFLDSVNKSPCSDPKSKSFILQNGDYQLPIYTKIPADFKSVNYYGFQYIPRIPCASLLIRIRKAPIGPDGLPLSLGGNIDVETASRMGVIATPNQYSEGAYNTSYCDVSATEMIIFEAKTQRHNPLHPDLIQALLLQYSEEPINDIESMIKYCEGRLLQKPPLDLSTVSKLNYLDIRFFSEYIPQLGFSTEVEILHQVPNKAFYYVVASLVPPGRKYKSQGAHMGLLDTHSATDIHSVYKLNFESSLKAIAFSDGPKKFYVTKTEATAVVIYEIKEVHLNGAEIGKVTTFGFSVMPVFQYVEVDGRLDEVEVYVNSSISQLPIFKGVPDESFVESIIKNPNVAGFLVNNMERQNIEYYPKTSLMVKIMDNQLEEYFKNRIATFDNINLQFMLVKNIKNYKFNYKKDYVGNRNGQLKKMLPKKMLPVDYEAKIFDYIQNHEI